MVLGNVERTPAEKEKLHVQALQTVVKMESDASSGVMVKMPGVVK